MIKEAQNAASTKNLQAPFHPLRDNSSDGPKFKPNSMPHARLKAEIESNPPPALRERYESQMQNYNQRENLNPTGQQFMAKRNSEAV